VRQRQPRLHDEAHLDFIRSLPCAVCGDDTSTEAAHLRTGSLRYGKKPTGMGEKPSDRWCLPLCGRCHRQQHQGNELEFWLNQGINPFVLAMSLHNATGDHDAAMEVLKEQARQVFA
jgi:hypothetical protein